MRDAFPFRMPAATPPLAYAVLRRYLGSRAERKIGTTVTVAWHGRPRSEHAALPPSLDIWLYDTRIAKVMPASVYFPNHHDRHHATDEWTAKILRDNGAASGCYREKFVLYAGAWNGRPRRPVEGQTFPAVDSCGACGAVLTRHPDGTWIAGRPFYTYSSFSSYTPGEPFRGMTTIRSATDAEKRTCQYGPNRGQRHEPWRDPATVQPLGCLTRDESGAIADSRSL
jgi:hypothetical protein